MEQSKLDWDSPGPLDTNLNIHDRFENVLWQVVGLEREKRLDYAEKDDLLKNIRLVAEALQLEGYDQVEDVTVMVLRKINRFINLRNRRANFESRKDTLLDLIAYSVLLYVAVEETEKQ